MLSANSNAAGCLMRPISSDFNFLRTEFTWVVVNVGGRLLCSDSIVATVAMMNSGRFFAIVVSTPKQASRLALLMCCEPTNLVRSSKMCLKKYMIILCSKGLFRYLLCFFLELPPSGYFQSERDVFYREVVGFFRFIWVWICLQQYDSF